MPLSVSIFSVLFLFRYLRIVVGIFTFVLYRPKPVLLRPRYKPRDATVVIPTTFTEPEELRECIASISKTSPAAVFVVTSDVNVRSVQLLCETNQLHNVKVLGVPHLNKRAQILKALPEVTTSITIFADDDVFWPKQYLCCLLAVFEDPDVGAGGTRQRVKRKEKPDLWNFLGIAYLERRAWNNIATNAIDGSISTLSGRTAAYRTEILKNTAFYRYFANDSFLGTLLNSDDDKCLTRFVYSNGWKIVLQSDSRAVIETTVEGNIKYLDQCLRWARAHWRGNLIVMNSESYWMSPRYLWGWYYIYLCQLTSLALATDMLLFYVLELAIADTAPEQRCTAFIYLGCWVAFTKIIKLIPHFLRHPSDIRFIPASILFSYFHSGLSIYATVTLTRTHWGSKKLGEAQQARSYGMDSRFSVTGEAESRCRELNPVKHVITSSVTTPLILQNPPLMAASSNRGEALQGSGAGGSTIEA